MELISFQVVILVFGLLTALFYLIFKLLENNRLRKARPGREMYACGEDLKPEQLNVPPEGFYKVFTGALRLQALRRAHSGRLSDYLLWVVAGAVLLILYVMLLW